MNPSPQKTLFALLLLGGLGTAALSAPPPDDPAKVEDRKKAAKALEGKPAPDFKADFALNGKAAKLADLKDKVVVLQFWAPWCPYCVESFASTKELHAKYKDKPVEVVGVTTYFDNYFFDKKTKKLVALPQKLTPKQERDSLKDYAAYHKLDYRLLLLPEKEYLRVSDAYSRGSVPNYFVLDKKGVIRLYQGGTNDETAKIFGQLIDKLLAEN
jgi:thiol-disulfide isomerase/thioredoxin